MNQELLISIFSYSKHTGVFTRRSTGRKCGTDNNGYLEIVINKNRYYCHRLAWLYVYGYFPENHIDHIDRDKGNNRIFNLREVSSGCNVINTGNFKNNTSGVKGVTFNNVCCKWIAQIKVNKCLKYIGSYSYFDDAVYARFAAEQCLEWNMCDSNSPAYKYIKRSNIT